MKAVTINTPFKLKSIIMQAKQSILSNQTLLPVSLVVLIIGAIISMVATYTTLSNQVEHLREQQDKTEQKLESWEEKYIPEKEVLLMFNAINTKLESIEGKIK